jgi:hypothetical protein
VIGRTTKLSRKLRIRSISAFAGMIALGLWVWVPTANALTLTNGDRMEHTFTIYEGDDEWSGKIQPDEILYNLCASSCSLSLGGKDDDETDFRGNETVLIWYGNLISTKKP